MSRPAILAFAPAHFIQSRIATQQIGLVLFVLLWLLFLLRYFATARRRELFAAGIALGLAVYSYVAALVLVPGYFAAMALAVGRRGAGPSLADHSWRGTPLAAACAGFGLALMPLVAWHLWYPERIVELVDYYTQHGYQRGSALGNARRSRVRDATEYLVGHIQPRTVLRHRR